MQSFQTSLDYQDLLEISGQDSEKFLQGQLTCDLTQFADSQYGLGALCNNKGRVYCSFRILKHGAAFFLAMQPGLLDITRNNLQKYIPFYKASLADAGPRFHRTGLAGPDAEAWLGTVLPALPDPGHSVTAGNDIVMNLGGQVPRFEVWSPAEADSLMTGCDLPNAEHTAWQLLDLEAGFFFIGTDDVEMYTPEEANLDLAGFVSFDKGCYTGQEIVARMHYRGKAGKRLYRISFAPVPVLETALKDSSGRTAGFITNLLYTKDNALAFSVLKTAPEQTRELVIQASEGAVPVTVSLPDYS